jgi:hypothetical protein
MAWSLSIPNVPAERFAQTVDLVVQRDAKRIALVGATRAAELAAQVAKDIIAGWDVAKDETRTFGAVLGGHANPDGIAAEGFGNDTIEVKVWHSGTRTDAPKAAKAAKATDQKADAPETETPSRPEIKG